MLSELEVPEPESSPVLALFAVQRVGGAVGVVEVSWNVSREDGGSVSEDLVPSSGTLQFVSNNRQQIIRISVLPDSVPERDEVMN